MTATRRGIDPDALADLEEQREFLLRSLDDLERERSAGDLDEQDYRALHENYTARAANVLRAIEQGRAALPRRRSNPRRVVGIVLVVAMLAGGAGAIVAAMSGSRRPGDTITGGVEGTTADRLAQAVALANEGRLTEALRIYDEVVADDPGDVRALLDRGLLLLQAGSATTSDALLARGSASIEQALTVDPGNPEALFYRALAANLRGDQPGVTAALQEALANDPPPALRAQIEDALAKAAAPGP